jgi:hypothetical protein
VPAREDPREAQNVRGRSSTISSSVAATEWAWCALPTVCQVLCPSRLGSCGDGLTLDCYMRNYSTSSDLGLLHLVEGCIPLFSLKNQRLVLLTELREAPGSSQELEVMEYELDPKKQSQCGQGKSSRMVMR